MCLICCNSTCTHAALSSNGIPDFLPYVTAIVGLAVLLVSICIIFIITVCVRQTKKKSKKDFNITSKPKQEDNVVYEEIDEFQQIPKAMHISKNMAYCHFQHDPKTMHDTKDKCKL